MIICSLYREATSRYMIPLPRQKSPYICAPTFFDILSGETFALSMIICIFELIFDIQCR